MNRIHATLQARRRRLRRRTEGMTLVEIMIVVIIMAMIATGVAVVAFPMIEESNKQQTESDLAAIRSAAETFRLLNRNADCPDVEALVEEGLISSQVRTTDAWGNEFDIECGNEVYVRSAGGDGEWGTEDDLPASLQGQ